VVVEDVAGFADALGLGRFALVGFSIGGHPADAYAAGHPGRVDRLVLVEAFIPPDTPKNLALLDAMLGNPSSTTAQPSHSPRCEHRGAPLLPAPVERDRRPMPGGRVRQSSSSWLCAPSCP
jgi:pimeloyl-ACP methyl ester carboxylesterase